MGAWSLGPWTTREVSTMILIRRRHEGQSQRRRYDCKSRGGSDATAGKEHTPRTADGVQKLEKAGTDCPRGSRRNDVLLTS